MGAGRPRGFDAEAALEQAMRVFWQKGYEGASIAELTDAMGINAPSLYAAFGNKEELYRRALDRYAAGPASFGLDALAAPTARDVVGRLLRGAIDLQCDPGSPGGSLIVQGVLGCGEAASPLRDAVKSQRAAGEAAIRRRFERAKAEGDLPAESSPGDLARYVVAVIYGMAVLGAGGAGRRQLQKVARIALEAFPG